MEITSKTPLVSVIIPCYNYGHFLAEALDSILAQSYSDWECIVVDDGSIDNTKQVAKDYEGKDSRIRYIHQENAGASAARNNGISNSIGRYIQLLDADDLLEPEKFEKQIETLTKNRCRIVYSDVKVFKHTKIKEYIFQENIFDVPKISSSDIGFGEKLLENPFTINAPLLDKTLFDDVGLFNVDIKSNEDWDFWLRCMFNKEQFIYEPKKNTYALVRIHATNHTHTQLWKVYLFRLKIRLNIQAKLKHDKLLLINQKYFEKEREALVNVAIDTFRGGERWKAVKRFCVAASFGRKFRYFMYAFLSPFISVGFLNKLVNYSFKRKNDLPYSKN